MEYMIELLKKHGITEIAVTVQYLPQIIKNHFGDGSEYGVRLHYFEETTPLGTAGSVRNAADFLDETFLVVSGDALTDFDLSRAVAFHHAKQAIATVVMTRVEVPLEYGVVMTREDGKIVRFLEKPSWSEVFSDTVNTGIYVLEPQVLELFEQGAEYDFSKDLFPLLMQNDLPLYGYVASGYWSDIGNLFQYRQTQFDMLDRQVDVAVKGVETLPGVWIGEDVTIEQGVQIEGPAYLGDGTVIEAGVRLGPYAIIGRHNWVEPNAHIEQSVVWNRNYLGKSCSVSGATLCHGVRVGEGAILHENAVVGDNSWIGDMTVINAGVKIWPEKTIGSNTIQPVSVIWGKSAPRSLFGQDGISGAPNYELTPDYVGKIAAAYGSCLPRGAAVSVSCDEHPYSGILKYAVIASLLAAGVRVRDIGSTLVPIARYECRRSNSDGGVHIRKVGAGNNKRIIVQFFDQDGLPIDKVMERKIENAFLQEDFPRPDIKGLGLLEQASRVEVPYIWEVLSRVNVNEVRRYEFKIVLHCESPQVMAVMHQLMERLGCRVISVFNGAAILGELVTDNHADLGIHIAPCGRTFHLWTEQGQILSESELTVLQAIVALKERVPVGIPVTAPSIIEEMTDQVGVPVIRTKTAARSLLEPGKISPLQVQHDGFYSVTLILDYLAAKRVTLHEAVSELPEFYIRTEHVDCAVEAKGRVMRRLMEEMKGEQLELLDGIKVMNETGWALILPDSEKAVFKVVAQGVSQSHAEELTDLYRQKIEFFKLGL